MPIDFDDKRSEQTLHGDCAICQANNKLAKDNFTRWARFVNDWIHEERQERRDRELTLSLRLDSRNAEVSELELRLQRLEDELTYARAVVDNAHAEPAKYTVLGHEDIIADD
jgi:SMC interacting uncharacterized protein involved in chromosome segregation